MTIPIRCLTCGKVCIHKYHEYLKRVQDSIHFSTDIKNTDKTVEGKVLDELGFPRYCCRRMFLSCVNISPEINNRLKSK